MSPREDPDWSALWGLYRAWWRQMRWHWARLWMDPEDALAWRRDPPQWFV